MTNVNSPNILLLDPFGPRKGYLRHRHFLRDWSGAYVPGHIPLPPLDLLYTASLVRKHGYNVHIVEASVNHWTHKKILEIIKEKKADFVLIPSTYFSLNDDKHLASLIRQAMPEAKVIFAGPYVTYEPDLVLADKTADFVILGDLEFPMLNIIRGDHSENVAYVHKGKIVRGKRTLCDFNLLPIPARDLIDCKMYKIAIVNKRNPVTVMTISRGCPHSKCKFCHAPLYTLGQVRYRNFDLITEEINEIVFKYKIKEILFKDQAFTSNRELVVKLCEYIIKNNITIPWRASTRVDLVDKELLELMKRAGCYQLSFGFESRSQKSLDMDAKGTTVEQSRKAARLSKEAGIEILGLFMFGMLGDTKETMEQLFKFALELDVDYAQFNNYFMVPGSPVYEEYLCDNSICIPCSIVRKYALSAHARFYSRPGYLFKQLAKVKSWDDVVFLLRTGIDSFLSYFCRNY